MRAALLPAFLVLLAGFSSASADTFDKSVKANSRTAVGAFFTYSEGTCQASVVPDVTVRTKPANGTVAIEVKDVTMKPDSSCPGARMRGPVFIYTPAKGFRGSDQFEIDIPFARTDVRPPTVYTHTYRIKVE
jgi:hypothetical protein